MLGLVCLSHKIQKSTFERADCCGCSGLPRYPLFEEELQEAAGASVGLPGYMCRGGLQHAGLECRNLESTPGPCSCRLQWRTLTPYLTSKFSPHQRFSITSQCRTITSTSDCRIDTVLCPAASPSRPKRSSMPAKKSFRLCATRDSSLLKLHRGQSAHPWPLGFLGNATQYRLPRYPAQDLSLTGPHFPQGTGWNQLSGVRHCDMGPYGQWSMVNIGHGCNDENRHAGDATR